MAVLLGTAIPNVTGWLKEQQLRAPARYLAMLARSARLAAIQHQCSYQINIQADRLWMEPVNPPAPPLDNLVAPTSAAPAETPAKEALPAPYQVADSTEILVQLWNEDKMRPPGKSIWTFAPDGLCEPIAVKFIQDRAELELDFDPLTATVSKEKLYRP